MKSFCIGIFMILVSFTTTTFPNPLNQDHYNHILKNRGPMKQILAAIFDNDPATQLKYLEAIQQHIDNNDDYAKFSEGLKTATQRTLDAGLKNIGRESVDIGEYAKAANDMESGAKLENPDLGNVINELKERKQQQMGASDEEKITYFNKIMSGVDDVSDQHDVQEYYPPSPSPIHFTSSPAPSIEENSEE